MDRPVPLKDALARFVGDFRPLSLQEILPDHSREVERALRDDFAFLLGLIADQSVRVETAWTFPSRLADRLVSVAPSRLATADLNEVQEKIASRPVLHRYPKTMAGYVIAAARRVMDVYGGDAASIWPNRMRAKAIMARLREFEGIGPKKASLGIQLLIRDRGAFLEGLDEIDVAIDSHVRRVLGRYWGMEDVSDDGLYGRARQEFPSFPGQLTPPTWAVGREWCRPSPSCDGCPLARDCVFRNRS